MLSAILILLWILFLFLYYCHCSRKHVKKTDNKLLIKGIIILTIILLKSRLIFGFKLRLNLLIETY